MKKNFYISLLISFLMGLLSLEALTPQEGKGIIDAVYEGLTGFNAHEEYERLEKEGVAPTYGEILYDSVETLLEDLKLTSEDVFYDCGSGIGKCVMQVYLCSPVKKSVGIEMSEIRHIQATEALKRLKKQNLLEPHRELEYKKANFLKTPLQDATVIFLCSTCFSLETMEKLTQKLSLLNVGLRILTLKSLPAHPSFKLTKTWQLPMTWSKNYGGSVVYLYTKIK